MKIDSANGFDLHWPSPLAVTGRTGFALAALLLALILVYANSFQAGFHLDDFGNVVDNPNIQARSLSRSELGRSIYGMDLSRQRVERPLAYLSFAINYRLNGWNPAGYHLVNFLFHCASAVVLYRLIQVMLGLAEDGRRYRPVHSGIALLAAFFWAVHPIHVSAVTYIVQRMTLMAGFFYLLAMLWFLRARTSESTTAGVLYAVGCLASGGLAFLSKENAVMLPVSLVLMEFLVVRDGSTGRSRAAAVWLAGALVVCLIIVLARIDPTTLLAGYSDRPFTVGERLLTQPRVWLIYVGLLAYPRPERLALLHDVSVSHSLLNPWTTLPALLIIVAIGLLAVAWTRKHPLAAFPVLFFLLNHLVEGSIIPLEMMFEHRNYLPSALIFVPVVLGFVAVLDRFSNRPAIQLAAAATVVVILIANGHTTFDRNAVFRNDVTLWEDNVRKAPGLHRPHHNLAKAYLAAGRTEAALVHLELALQGRAAARLQQKYMTHYNYGLYELLNGRLEAARRHLNQALTYDPDDPDTHNKLALVLLFQRRLPDAVAHAREAVRRNPYRAEFYHTLGLIALRLGAPDQAIAQALRARRQFDDRHRSAFILGEAFRLKGDLVRAERYFDRYRRHFPDHLSVRFALIDVYAATERQDRLDRAVPDLFGMLGNTPIDAALNDYALRYNYAEPARVDAIRRAIRDTLCRATEPPPAVISGGLAAPAAGTSD